MIIEKIPDIQKLSVEEKIILAEEIWENIGDADMDLPISKNHIDIIEERWKHYLANPESASSWEDVKKRLKKNSP